ncbi:MAG: ABC transporter permease, partial [Gemmatimonas sp.]
QQASAQKQANTAAPPVMSGAEPPPDAAAAAAKAQQAANAAAPMAMPGAQPPVMPGAQPPVMPGAQPPAMPGASPPPAAATPRPQVQPHFGKAAEPPARGEAGHDHGDDQITAFFVGTKNRYESLMLQREMNTDFTEPLTAVIPGVALAELFNSIGSAEVGLRVVALFAVGIGLTGMLVALYSSLDARRREMAILRSVGAGPGTIVSLLVIESGLLALLGCLIGVGLVYLGLVLGQGPIEQRFGLHLAISPMKQAEYNYLALILGSGILVGFVPAWKAYRTSLADGLSPRT